MATSGVRRIISSVGRRLPFVANRTPSAAIEAATLHKERRRAVKYREADEEGKKGTPFELYLAPSPCADQPVVYFQHIRKTAGTSLRQVMHRNYMKGSDGTRHLVLNQTTTNKPDRLREWAADLLTSLSDRDRDSIICAVGHGANYLMHQLDRPARAMTILRDPVERVMSMYHHATESHQVELPNILHGEKKKNRWRRLGYFNGQSRSLLEPLMGVEIPQLWPSPSAPADADTWRRPLFDLLDRLYLVGIQDRFEESVSAFAREFGWEEVFLPEAKVNVDRPREVDPELRATILGYNWLDQELYERFARRPIAKRPVGGG